VGRLIVSKSFPGQAFLQFKLFVKILFVTSQRFGGNAGSVKIKSTPARHLYVLALGWLLRSQKERVLEVFLIAVVVFLNL
jgi:hypothetical protein